MIFIFTYIFITYGITTIVVEGEIFEDLRTWIGTKSDFIYSIFTCPLCFSTWLGFFLSAILMATEQYTPTCMALNIPFYSTIFLDGCFTAGTTWFLYKLNNK